MKKKVGLSIILLLVVAVSFLAGYWVNQGNKNSRALERKILYYVDPMNPAFRADKPGTAPCGMALEPVYADRSASGQQGTGMPQSLPPGSVRISSEKQQLIGVKTAIVEKTPWSHTLRVLGRVTLDETRIYRINAAVPGLIKNALPVTTGSFVRENELLATFYSSLEYRALVQSYFNSMKLAKSGSWNVEQESTQTALSKAQLSQIRKTARDLGQSGETSQIDYYRRNILNSGISAYQLAEMERTRTIPEEIEIRSPAQGLVVLRNVNADLRFDKGAELYRIADIRRIWVMADVFENEAAYFQPGRQVKMELPYQKKVIYATVSNVLPQFDPSTRTLKIRLETGNPNFVLRPDMFVNVELPVSGPPAIIVPVDAVLDSGLKKTVFVDRGNGIFEPRQVETGRSLGERVEVTKGLMTGERIVVSGNFLIDSETRMQQVASGTSGNAIRDPVCGMNADEEQARTAGHVHEYQGKKYYFCSRECRDEFVKSPERYNKVIGDQGKTSIAAMPAGLSKTGKRKPDAAMTHKGHDHGAMESTTARPSSSQGRDAGMTKAAGDRANMKTAAPMTHEGHDQAMPPRSSDSSQRPMQDNMDAMTPTSHKTNLPADMAPMTDSKKGPMPSSERAMPLPTGSPVGSLPAAGSATPMMPGAVDKSMSTGKSGAMLPPPGGGPPQPGMTGTMPADPKMPKQLSPGTAAAPTFPASSGEMKPVDPASAVQEKSPEAPGERNSKTNKYPANMRTKSARGARSLPLPAESIPAPPGSELNSPDKKMPAINGQMQPGGGP